MSSLSQEDLDLDSGWDDGLEKSPAPVESLIVRGAPGSADVPHGSDGALKSAEANGATPATPPEPEASSENHQLAIATVPEDPTSIPRLQDSSPPVSGFVSTAPSVPTEMPLLPSRPAAAAVDSEAFIVVAAKPRLLSQPVLDIEPIADSGVTVAQAADAAEFVEPPVTRGVSLDKPTALAVALSKPIVERRFVRHWRLFATAATVVVLLVVSLIAMRFKRESDRPRQAIESPMPGPRGQAAAATVGSAATAQSGDPYRPAAATAGQAESFSESFVKHAASVDSKWGDVKKRPKVVDSNHPTKSSGAVDTAANDNPLEILNKLEKVRKAKKQAADTP